MLRSDKLYWSIDWKVCHHDVPFGVEPSRLHMSPCQNFGCELFEGVYKTDTSFSHLASKDAHVEYVQIIQGWLAGSQEVQG